MNRTKASDFGRAIAHMKIVLSKVLHYMLLHPLPEPEPLPGKSSGVDSIYAISRATVATLVRSSSLSATELRRERDECLDAVRLALQLTQMLREYATEAAMGTRRLQRILSAAASIRVYAVQLKSIVKTILPKQEQEETTSAPIKPDDRKKLVELKQALMVTVVELNEVRRKEEVLLLCSVSSFHLQNLASWLIKQKDVRKEAKLDVDVDIWSEEPEAPGCVLYFQDKAQYEICVLLFSIPPPPTFTYSFFFSSDGALRAGTLNQLVMRLTSETKGDLTFVKAMIVTLHSYTTPEQMFKKLLQRSVVSIYLFIFFLLLIPSDTTFLPRSVLLLCR